MQSATCEPTQPQDAYITLTEAAKLTPARISANAVWRWCRLGIRARSGERIYLQHIRSGGRVFTRRDWLDSFFQAVAAADSQHFNKTTSPLEPSTGLLATSDDRRTDRQRQRAVDAASRELQEAGWR